MAKSNPTARIVILLLLMWALLMINLGRPWLGHHDANGVWISSAVRNYHLYGPREVGFLVTTNRAPVDNPDELDYYIHHPPLIVWSVALAGIPFGQSEAAARWLAASATLISLAAFYVAARRLAGNRYALLCVALYGLTPMIAYFGRMPNHEPLALAFIMLFLAIFINWLRRPTTGRWLALAILAVLAMWTAWASAFLLAALGLIGLIYGRPAQRLAVVGLGVMTLLGGLSVIGFYEWQRPGAIDRLADAFIWRTSNVQLRPGDESFTALEFIVVQLAHLVPLAGPLLLTAGGLGLLMSGWRPVARAVTGALMLGGLAYIVVFSNASYIHDYYKIYLLPGLALAAAMTIMRGFSARRGRRFMRPIIVGLAISSLLIGVVFFWGLHRSAQRDYLIELSEALNQQTTETIAIAGNLPAERGLLIDFYAWRAIRWQVAPEEVTRLASETAGGITYIYCATDAEDHPDGLADYPYESFGNCRIIAVRYDDES
jgi:4-amino-4-deoxy-L-arabinose transferase-like glycosyltransferase